MTIEQYRVKAIVHMDIDVLAPSREDAIKQVLENEDVIEALGVRRVVTETIIDRMGAADGQQAKRIK